MLAAAALGAATLAACERAADSAAVHRDKGDELFKKREWAAAAGEYAASLQADPKQDKLWEKTAFAYMKAGNTDEAASTLLKTLDQAKEPKDKAEVYRKIAGAYLEAKQPDNAEKYFLEALKADPKDSDSLAWLGEISSTRGGARDSRVLAVPTHLDKAVAYYDQAIALDPAAPMPYVNKRIAMMKYMQYERSEIDSAERDAQENRKDKAKVAEANARAAQHRARADELKAQIDELTKKINEFQKAAKPK